MQKALLLLAALTGTAAAQALIPRPGAQEKDLPPFDCTSQQVTVEVEQQVARVRIEQTFVNRSGHDLEAVYFMPLSEQASISRFSYWVGGKEIVGQVEEKQQARQQYEKAVAAKRDPALLEQAGRNLFRVNVYPVSSREPLKVVLEYSQLCPYEQGTVRLRYPLTAGGAQQHIQDFRFQASVADQKPIDDLSLPSHGGAQIVRPDAHHAQVRLEKQNFTPNQDIALEYRLKSQDFGVSFLTHRQPGEDGYFMLVIAPQEKTSQQQVVKKDVIFVFDRSGSMDGEKMGQAKAALSYCLKKLSPQDRFQVISFSDDVRANTPQLQPASSANIHKAVQEVQQLQADGGTNIDGALTAAMKNFSSGPNQKIILFMTDGLPTVGEQDIGAIVKHVAATDKHAVRLFAFGVGDDVDDYLLLKLASDHRGALQYVRGGESIESKIGAFFAKISTPVLVNLSIDYGKIQPTRCYPESLPDVFKGSQLIVVGRYAQQGPQELVLNGEINGQKRTFRYPAQFDSEQQQNPFLPRLWAKQRVDWAIDQIRLKGENEELKQEVIRLSKAYNFMTPYTSFLAMSKEERAASSAPGYPRGADPILSVQAPAQARVTAYFPWGETRPLTYDKKAGQWKCRFVIPSSVAQSACKVAVVVTMPNGSQERQTVCFEADADAPSGRATALLRFGTVYLEAHTSPDTSRVIALLDDGRSLDLKKNRPGHWLAQLPGPARKVDLTLLDHGHNRTTLHLEVR
jgi:Ca-activated chloride channel family protein